MKIFALAAALAIAPTAASATTINFDNSGLVAGQDAYAAEYTQYNQAVNGASVYTGPASVAGVEFSGTAGVDFGPFGFDSNGTAHAFLQSFPGLNTGSFTLTSLGLSAGQAYQLVFTDVLRNTAMSYSISQGGVLIDTLAAGASRALQTLNFTSNGGTITFAAVGTSSDASVAIDSIVVTAVPEAATWAMMLLGFGMIGGAMRSRKQTVRVSFS